jgi:hypothetical protein
MVLDDTFGEGVVDPEVVVDSLRLRQVLTNLMSNAIKFTSTGYVMLMVVPIALDPRDDYAGGVPHLLFSVVDTGVGMDPDTINRLFQPFSQGLNATAGTVSSSSCPRCPPLAPRALLASHLRVDADTRAEQGSVWPSLQSWSPSWVAPWVCTATGPASAPSSGSRFPWRRRRRCVTLHRG